MTRNRKKKGLRVPYTKENWQAHRGRGIGVFFFGYGFDTISKTCILNSFLKLSDFQVSKVHNSRTISPISLKFCRAIKSNVMLDLIYFSVLTIKIS